MSLLVDSSEKPIRIGNNLCRILKKCYRNIDIIKYVKNVISKSWLIDKVAGLQV
jgi:hypothetical protein